MLFTAGLLSFVAAATAQQVVTVGFTASDPGGIFQFKPNNFNATNGTTITFQFTGAPGNHSVTQSAFADPCNPLAGGFDSGWVFLPGPDKPNPAPEFNLTITNDSKPIWFFCKQLQPSPHCGAGMVGAINAPVTGNTFANFQKAAAGKTTSGQSQNGLVGIGASASAGIGPIPSGATAYTGVIAAASGTGASGAGGSSPSATSPSGGSPSTTAKGAAGQVAANSLLTLAAAALGFVLA